MRLLTLIGLCGLLSACATVNMSSTPSAGPAAKQTAKLPSVEGAVPLNTPRKSGGYYLDDGPMDSVPADILSIPDATPKAEPYLWGANRPYEALGEVYFPDLSGLPFSERGIATWYGRKFHGKLTSSGEPYDMFGMTAAHKTLPIPSYARVTNIQTGKTVIVRINDRGPFFPGRVIDLSYTAASKLGFAGKGSGEVLVERVFPGEGPRVAEAAPPSKVAALSSSVAAPGQYYLQLGAFSDPGNAERLLETAKSSLGDWAAKLNIESDGRIHRVKLGPLASDSLTSVSALIEKSLSIKARLLNP